MVSQQIEWKRLFYPSYCSVHKPIHMSFVFSQTRSRPNQSDGGTFYSVITKFDVFFSQYFMLSCHLKSWLAKQKASTYNYVALGLNTIMSKHCVIQMIIKSSCVGSSQTSSFFVIHNRLCATGNLFGIFFVVYVIISNVKGLLYCMLLFNFLICQFKGA